MELKDLKSVLNPSIYRVFSEVERKILMLEGMNEARKSSCLGDIGAYLKNKREELYGMLPKDKVDDDFAKAGDFIVNHVLKRVRA